ncbi:glycosyltransferase [Actinomycetospora sp. NBC_00405]|uniref:glycosyltransferase n=1 Tax=Actinomycetospora sp. NBC_00405 TaxID=2975952 RepID=UPI002E1E7576
MKVLHVITGLAAGGAEQQVRLLCRYSRTDSEVAVLTGTGVVAEGLLADGVPVHAVGMRGNRDLRGLVRLVRLVRRGRFDCVHVHLFRAQVHGRLAARLAGVAHVVATEHSLGDRLLEGRPTARPGVRTLYRAAELLGDRSIAVSATVARRLQRWGVPPDRITVIPNGVEVERLAFRPERRHRTRTELGIPAGAPVVGTAGRLVESKRVDVVIDALAVLPGTWGLVVGTGPAADELRHRVARLGLGDRVVLTGERADVADLLAAMDVFVSACPEETYGLGIVEAAAAGLPVVYAACPALEEQPGDLAPRARRVEADSAAVAAAVAELLADPALASREPAPVAEVYDIRRVAARLDEEYARLGRDDRPPVPATREGGIR